jgi:hypothetical protein
MMPGPSVGSIPQGTRRSGRIKGSSNGDGSILQDAWPVNPNFAEGGPSLKVSADDRPALRDSARSDDFPGWVLPDSERRRGVQGGPGGAPLPHVSQIEKSCKSRIRQAFWNRTRSPASLSLILEIQPKDTEKSRRAAHGDRPTIGRKSDCGDATAGIRHRGERGAIR